jgi:hypothetical protein
MKKLATAPLLLLLAACGTASGPGYMNTDVLEPTGFSRPIEAGVRYDKSRLMEGTLTYMGPGDIHKTYVSYVDAMCAAGWAKVSSDGDPTKGMNSKLSKDTRTVSVDITPEAGGNLKLIIKVGATK